MKVPDALSDVSSRVTASAKTTVPPLIVPKKFHDPVVAFSVSVAPALFSVPVRLITPPARLIVPMPAVVKVPPRFTVLAALPSRWRMPMLVQAFASDSVPPPIASIVPALVKVVATPTDRDCAVLLADNRPLLINPFAPLFSHCSPIEA